MNASLAFRKEAQERGEVAEPRPLEMHSPRFASRGTRRMGEGTKIVLKRLGGDEEAAMELSKVGASALAIAFVLIGAVVAVKVAASLLPEFGASVNSLSENFTLIDWGDSTANSLGPTMGMLIALGGMFSIVGLIIGLYVFRRNRGQGS